MKKSIILAFLFLISLQGHSQDRQAFNENIRLHFYMMQDAFWNYTSFTSKGEKINGKPHGKWIDIASDSTVYREYEFFEGTPVGVWRINNPKGGPRKITYYDSKGNVQKWVQYDIYTRRLIEIHAEDFIAPRLMYAITEIEEKQFTLMSIKPNNNSPLFSYKPILIFDYLSDYLRENSFSGSLTFFEDSKKNRPSVKYFFDSGIEVQKHYYNYSGKRLKSISVYRGEKFMEKIRYDKEGNVKKAKKS